MKDQLFAGTAAIVAVLLLGTIASAAVRKHAVESIFISKTEHQYQWSNWLTLNDGKSNGIQFAFRKGDNNFVERGMVFVRLYNRYRSTISGDVTFVIVNNTTGAESSTQSEPFYMKAESLKESGGSWFLVPGNNENPDIWARTSISLREIRVKGLRFSNE